MGTLFSSPKPAFVPVQQSEVVQAPLPVSSQSNTTSPQIVAEAVDTAEETVAQDEEKARETVRRASRGRGSTILTSFRGVLNDNNTLAPQRKNLLGE